MATFVGVEEDEVIMAFPGVVTNSWLMCHHRRLAGETRDLPALLVTGSVGVAGERGC